MTGGVRLDLLILECVGQVVKTCVEPRCKDMPIWNSGLRDVMAAKLKEVGISSEPVTIVHVARAVGILGPDPDVIVVNPPRKRRVPRV